MDFSDSSFDPVRSIMKDWPVSDIHIRAKGDCVIYAAATGERQMTALIYNTRFGCWSTPLKVQEQSFNQTLHQAAKVFWSQFA